MSKQDGIGPDGDLFDVTLPPMDIDSEPSKYLFPDISIQVNGAHIGITDVSGKNDDQVAEEAAKAVHDYVLEIIGGIREEIAIMEEVKKLKVDLSGL